MRSAQICRSLWIFSIDSIFTHPILLIFKKKTDRNYCLIIVPISENRKREIAKEKFSLWQRWIQSKRGNPPPPPQQKTKWRGEITFFVPYYKWVGEKKKAQPNETFRISPVPLPLQMVFWSGAWTPIYTL